MTFLSALFQRRVTAFAAAVVASVAFAGTPARAATSDTCPEASSLRLVTVSTPSGYVTQKLWVYQPSESEVHICFAAGSTYVRGDLILRAAPDTGFVVTPDFDPTACPLYDLVPVDGFRLWFDLNASPYTFCIGVGDVAVGVTVVGPAGSAGPAAELWFDKGTVAGGLWCSTHSFAPGCGIGPPADGVRVY